MFPEILYILAFAGLLWTAIIYNKLIVDRNRVLTAWSDIDVQLKRRHDLVPKLVEAVKQYAAYETATLQAVTELRVQSGRIRDIEDVGRLERRLGEGLHRLIALAEDYPDLKANQPFLDLQHGLTEVENHIQYARRYYNGAVRNLNVRIESFPDLVIAKLFRFRQAQFFDMGDEQ